MYSQKCNISNEINGAGFHMHRVGVCVNHEFPATRPALLVELSVFSGVAWFSVTWEFP